MPPLTSPLPIALSFACALLAFIGCGGAELNRHLRSCEALRAYPSASHLRASAIGEGVEQARDRASAKIARDLSAELDARVTVDAASDSERGERAQVSERIEVASHFKHAELISEVEACEVCRGARCVSWVTLSRDDAARRLVEDAAEDTRRFHEATRDLKPETPLARFVQAWRQARAAYQALSPTLNQLNILERTSRDLLAVRDEMRRASDARAERAARLALTIEPLKLSRVDTGDALNLDALPRAVEDRMSHALAKLKLKRSRDDSSCSSSSMTPSSASHSSSSQRSPRDETETRGETRGPEWVRLTPRGELTCKLGFVGPQCELSLSVKLEGCSEGTLTSLTEVNWSELKLIGADSRSAQAALTRVEAALKAQDLSALLKRTLSPFVLF